MDEFGQDPVAMMAEGQANERGVHGETDTAGVSVMDRVQGVHGGEREVAWGSSGEETLRNISRSRSRSRTYASGSVVRGEDIEMAEIVERPRSRSPCSASGSGSLSRRSR